MTLTEFLLARIAEDEASMRGVLAMDARTERAPEDFGKYVVDPIIGPYGGQSQIRDVARGLHLARFGSPTRVLAECEAKRRIVELHFERYSLRAPVTDNKIDVCDICGPFDWPFIEVDGEWVQSPSPSGGTFHPCQTLRLLGQVYGDHPDYDEAWRP